MAAATFRHLASRNLDPQLHTHAVIANMTRGRDGGLAQRRVHLGGDGRSLLIGAYYRNELRTRLEGIGYATVPTLVGRMPGFEIAGYQRPMLDAFSTRRRELLDYMQDRGWENTAARTQQAALYTRRRKAEPDRQVSCMRRGKSGRRRLGPARDRDVARGRNGVSASAFPQSEARAPPSALSVVRRAVEHLEERRTVFSANDLRAWALAHGGGRHSLEALDAGIAQLRHDGHLIEVTARRADKAFVTDRARNAERDIIAGMRVGLDAGRSLAPDAAVEPRLDAAGLNPGQRDAARTILLSPHRTVGVQGHAGSGKTTMLRTVAELAEERQIVGLAPSASAAHVLAAEADIPARTLQGFLTRYRDVGDGIASPERMEEARKTLSGAVLNVHMRTQDGREIAMARDAPQLHHLDHAYSSTVHAVQGLTCDRVIAVLDTDRGAPADQAMFYVELTRARDNVVLLTDDREALVKALETSPAEELSALKAIGEQFAAPAETIPQRPPPERAAVLDDATRERRKAADRFVGQTLSAAAASIREREERARVASAQGARITQASGYAEWREGAGRALADCRRILDDPETFGRHLDHCPGATDEFKRLSARIETDLASDKAEIDRLRQQQNQRKLDQQKLDQQKQEHQEQARRKAKTRDMGGLEL